MFLLLWAQPIILPQPTAQRYYPLRRDKFNVYIDEPDITLEEALLLWMEMQRQ